MNLNARMFAGLLKFSPGFLRFCSVITLLVILSEHRSSAGQFNIDTNTAKITSIGSNNTADTTVEPFEKTANIKPLSISLKWENGIPLLKVLGSPNTSVQIQVTDSPESVWKTYANIILLNNGAFALDFFVKPSQQFYRAIYKDQIDPPKGFVYIKPGTFLMGSPETEAGRYPDETQRFVEITKGFWISNHEVNQGEFSDVLGFNPAWNQSRDIINRHLPVENVSWFDANQYCYVRTQLERASGAISTQHKYDLPTEAEWEYAARAGTTSARYGEIDRIAWWDVGWSERQTRQIQIKEPNAWGLYDMIGNVREWCSDWYGPYSLAGKTDPVGPLQGQRRISRGGSYYDSDECRSAARIEDDPGMERPWLGFRVVLRHFPDHPNANQSLSQINTTAGNSIKLIIEANGALPLSYQWYKDGVALNNATDSGLFVSSAVLGDSGKYSVVISNASGKYTNLNAEVTVYNPMDKPIVISHPKSIIASEGEPVSLRVEALGPKTIKFQWWKDGLILSGADSAVLSIPAVGKLDAGEYHVEVSGTASNKVLSQRATVKIVSPTPAYSEGFVWISPGSFIMGSPDGEIGRQPTDQDQKIVNVANGFWMLDHEVTNQEYEQVMGEYNLDTTGPLAHPVTFKTRRDVDIFCYIITQRERAKKTIGWNQQFRLPTEIEWEYAARAGTIEPTYGPVAEIAWYADNAGGTIHPVKIKTPNAWGLYDMIGNVSEFCLEWYIDSFDRRITVVRGGNFRSEVKDLRAANRDYGTANTGWGFRIILTPDNNSAPTIIRQPISMTTKVGQPARFSVDAVGQGVLTYQWKKNGVNILEATESSLIIPSTRFDDEGNYSVSVISQNGYSHSVSVKLIVKSMGPVALPVVLFDSYNIFCKYNESVRLSANVVSEGYTEYRWLKDGAVIAGKTNLILILSPKSPEGLYQIEVKNIAGSVVSKPVLVTVHLGPIKWVFFRTALEPGATPAIGSDGTVYVAGRNSYVYALNSATGARKWEFRTAEANYGAPAIGSDDTVYIGGWDKKVYALNGVTGAKRWEFLTGGPNSPAIGNDNTVYVGSRDKKVYALNGGTGVKKWEFLTGGSVLSSPSIGVDGTVYVGSTDQKIYALNRSNGAKKWEFLTGGSIDGSPAIGADGTVYTGSQDKKVYALNGATGVKKWEFLTRGEVWSYPVSPVIGLDGTVYVLAPSVALYALDSSTGKKKWEFPIPGRTMSSPAIGEDNSVYFSGGAGLIALDGASGQIKGEVSLMGSMLTSPTIGPDGTIYVGHESGLEAVSSLSKGLARSPWPKIHGDSQNTGRIAVGFDRLTNDAPVIIEQPQGLIVSARSNAVLTVVASGTRPLSYQWFFNGTVLSGSTRATLILTNLQASKDGNYWVVVSNLVSNVTSAVAKVSVESSEVGGPSGFVWIAPGTFVMGSPSSEPNRGSDELQHTVTLTQGYWMSDHEVTQAEYQSVMGSNPSTQTGDLNRPVEQVTRNDAVAYCKKLTERERAAGRITTLHAYRLPTEAEWEYAARAGTTGARHGELDAIAWHGGNSGNQTHAVKQKAANAWGLYDMMGNVDEWCSDWYGDYPTGSVTDPMNEWPGYFRVSRGGSFNVTTSIPRSAHRISIPPHPNVSSNRLGFRPALSSVR